MDTTINDIELRTQEAVRYIAPLREGGSLPGLMEADDGFRYVVKYRGAGHGTKALIAELIGGEVARMLGLKVPELVFLNLNEDFGRTEADEEIQDLLRWSQGLNLGLHYLYGTMTFDPYANDIDPMEASMIVWLDAFLTNIDRTARNTNTLIWRNREIWLIDHGASLYFHHSWSDPAKAALTPFPYIKDHVMLPKASMLDEANARARSLLTPEKLEAVVNLIPDDWLQWEGAPGTPEELRKVYLKFLTTRLANADIFIKHAEDVRKQLI